MNSHRKAVESRPKCIIQKSNRKQYKPKLGSQIKHISKFLVCHLYTDETKWGGMSIEYWLAVHDQLVTCEAAVVLQDMIIFAAEYIWNSNANMRKMAKLSYGWYNQPDLAPSEYREQYWEHTFTAKHPSFRRPHSITVRLFIYLLPEQNEPNLRKGSVQVDNYWQVVKWEAS
jgi:hypothetical protein